MNVHDRNGSPLQPTRAIIDIGSNTVRLVVYGGPARAPVILHNEKVTAQLGRGLGKRPGEAGMLAEKAMTPALAALARYAALIRILDVPQVDVVATAATRDAANGEAFLDQVRALGLKPRQLSGEEEALTSAMGVMAAFPGAKGVVGDLGGGSLELVDIDGDSCEHGVSMPLGTLRLPQFRVDGPAKFAAEVARTLSRAQWKGGKGLPLFLVGGACRAVARYAMHAARWPLDDPHGFELAPERAIELFRSLMDGSNVLAQVPGLSASRLASLPDAAALLAILIGEIQPSRLIFSSWGLREGLAYRHLNKAARTQHPLLAGVSAFIENHGTSSAVAAMVAGWTAAANPVDGRGKEHLRLAATMLALASRRIEPNLRAEHAADWALRKRWIGVDAEGRAMLAVALLADSGRSALPAALGRLAPEESLREALAWGQAIRLCRRLSAGTSEALSNSWLGVKGGALLLAVREPLTALYNDSIEKNLRTLADTLALRPAFVAIAADAGLPGSSTG